MCEHVQMYSCVREGGRSLCVHGVKMEKTGGEVAAMCIAGWLSCV